MKTLKKIILIFLCITIFFIGFNIFVILSLKSDISTLENAPKKYTGLVLGAGAKKGIISYIFQDRLDTAIAAYKSGKIQKILISGDNGTTSYDELTPAKIYVWKMGVKKEDIFLDYAGFDTYDSMYRANAIFLADELLVFTQDFHLPRALYLCDELDIKCHGVISNKRKYLGETRYTLRENLARIKAFFNTFIWNSKPKFLGDTIDIRGNGNYDIK